MYNNIFLNIPQEDVSKVDCNVIARAIARSNPLRMNTLDCFATLAMTLHRTFDTFSSVLTSLKVPFRGFRGRGFRGILILAFLALCFTTNAQDTKELVILHLNDTHSRIEPFPANDSRNPNKGGAVRQDAYIEDVRKETTNVLLFHCGDFVQGTPYFNIFKGEAEVAIMNFMKVDAACIGNHEFDFGLETLSEMIKQAKFPIIATNYDFSNTSIRGLTKDYLIMEKDGIKIGILAVGIDPNGLVTKQNYEGMLFLDPVETANKTAEFLKNEEHCDLIICLSHLGYFPSENEMGDISLAKQTRHIDIILGGHSHTFLRQPDRRLNLDGKDVVINQMGGYGLYVGRLDVVMEKNEKMKE